MRFTLPGFVFITSKAPLEFDTDGHKLRFQSAGASDPADLLVLSRIDFDRFNMRSIPAITPFEFIGAPDDFHVPRLYKKDMEIGGKSILILMLNGWGDTILVQPALHALYLKGRSRGKPPRITVGCNWIDNFPYPDAPFIEQVRPNIMPFEELRRYDIVVNLMAINYRRSAEQSMCDQYFEILGLGPEFRPGGPSIQADRSRVEKIRPHIEAIRNGTGRKLLCINWRSRFAHKNAPAELFFEIEERLRDEYQSVLFKDGPESEIMQRQIDAASASIINLSSLVSDYHDTVAALSLMDAFISVDTGIVHAAGALGIPGVALFGPFPPETHVADYPSVRSIRAPYRGSRCNGPCLETHRGCAELNFAPDKISPCFTAIEPADVVRKLNEAVGSKPARRAGSAPMRILVVGAVQGATIPIGRSLTRALREAGTAAELLDFSDYGSEFLLVRNEPDPDKTMQFYLKIRIALLERIASFRPDAVLGIAQSPLNDPEMLETIRRSGIRLCYWFTEDYRIFDYWKTIAPWFDPFFIIQKEPFVQELEKIGCRTSRYLPMAFDQSCSAGHTDGEPEIPVSFVGAPYPNRVHYFRSWRRAGFEIYGEDWDSHLCGAVVIGNRRITEEEAQRIYRRTLVNINLHSSAFATGFGDGDFVNPRTFELAGLGLFQITDMRKLLPLHFDPADEIVALPQWEDLEYATDYFLKRPHERRRFAEKARTRVLREHTYRCRAEEILATIR